MLIHVAGEEMLLTDATRVAQRAKDAGVEVTIEVTPEMFHVWHIFAGHVPESDEAVAKVGSYLREKL